MADLGLKWKMAAACLAAASGLLAAEPAATAKVTVDLSTELRPVKPMNSVNNGPSVSNPGGSQLRGNFEDYRAARFPLARLHDSVGCVSGGAHAVDVNAVFPDFEADENDPKSYDFVFTDHYLDAIRRAGTEIFYRLGQTIEHGPKKYGVLPPKDFAKWARICEHIVAHYNEGWGWGSDRSYATLNVAWSNQFNIAYWEIWNEPDLDASEAEPPQNPRTWGGTTTNFFRLYEVAARHLKTRFPDIRVGGPAVAGRGGWSERFLDYCREREVPLDFFSWHIYSRTPEAVARRCSVVRKLLDARGFPKAESILNEWNYVKGWREDWVYTLRVESGDRNLKGAAYIAATMALCQNRPLDHLMFYDARLNCAMNNLFEPTAFWPLKGYYPFYAWSRLRDHGAQVACTVTEGREKDSDANTGNVEKKDRASSGQFYAVAARGGDGAGAVLIVRYSDDDNSSETGAVELRIPGVDLARARCCLTDMARTHTEVPLPVAADGSATLRLQPLSFALVEWGREALVRKPADESGVLLLAFDDRNFEDWETALPLFGKYGAHATFFVSGDMTSNAVRVIRRLAGAGHAVGLHGRHHADVPPMLAKKGWQGYCAAELDPVLSQCAAAGIPVSSFAYPNGWRDGESDRLLLSRFRRLRGLVGSEVRPFDPKGEHRTELKPLVSDERVFFPAADLPRRRVLGSVLIGEAYATDIDDIVACIERAGRNKEVLSLASHGIRPDAKFIHMKTDWLEKILAAARHAQVKVISYDEIVDFAVGSSVRPCRVVD